MIILRISFSGGTLPGLRSGLFWGPLFAWVVREIISSEVKMKRKAIKRCESHVLPGFESAVREGEAAKVEAERLALEEAMRAPAQSIESAAGRIEHDGPLFQGKIHAMLF